MGALVNTAGDTGPIAAAQAAAEAGAQTWADYYRANPGVPADTAGSDPQPVPVSGPAAVTGTPWDQQ